MACTEFPVPPKTICTMHGPCNDRKRTVLYRSAGPCPTPGRNRGLTSDDDASARPRPRNGQIDPNPAGRSRPGRAAGGARQDRGPPGARHRSEGGDTTTDQGLRRIRGGLLPDLRVRQGAVLGGRLAHGRHLRQLRERVRYRRLRRGAGLVVRRQRSTSISRPMARDRRPVVRALEQAPSLGPARAGREHPFQVAHAGAAAHRPCAADRQQVGPRFTGHRDRVPDLRVPGADLLERRRADRDRLSLLRHRVGDRRPRHARRSLEASVDSHSARLLGGHRSALGRAGGEAGAVGHPGAAERSPGRMALTTAPHRS